ncbi:MULTISPECIES: hypothetical protein [unclassified Inquilinus]|uniref:hypothetical protein n=1 Tax=unclassified Inquilinus TaxID=2645927 RepID=UPI003F8F156E
MSRQISHRLLPVLACVLATAAATGAGAASDATGMRAIGGAYRQLVHELEQSHGARPDSAASQRIAAAARDFQDALKRDGGARPELATDARNIVVSLGDGTFSADGSIAALRRDARGSVITAEPWIPSPGGDPIPGAIGIALNQTGEGDCVGISVIKAFSDTPAGTAILHKAVTANADGSFNISFPGDATTVYHLGPDDLDQFGKGDPAAAALVGAMFRYFHRDPSQGALPTNKVMELLAGTLGDHARRADAEMTPQEITDFLAGNADNVGRGVAMVFGGKPGRNGEWTKGDGHAFAVIRIDPAAGMLTYTNPWNEATTRTIAIADLARQAAGTSADFETVTFR